MLFISLAFIFILFFIRGHFVSCSRYTGNFDADKEVFPGYLSPQFLTFAEKYIAESRYSGVNDTVFRHLRDGNSVPKLSESKSSHDLIDIPTTDVPTKSLDNIPGEFSCMPEVLRKWNFYHGSLDKIGAIIGWASHLEYIENIIKDLKLSTIGTSYVITTQDVFNITSIESISSKSITVSCKLLAVNLFKFKFLHHLSTECERKNFYKNIIAIQLNFKPFSADCTIEIKLKSYDLNVRKVLDRCFSFPKY